jgi:hypothetical protein
MVAHLFWCVTTDHLSPVSPLYDVFSLAFVAAINFGMAPSQKLLCTPARSTLAKAST